MRFIAITIIKIHNHNRRFFVNFDFLQERHVPQPPKEVQTRSCNQMKHKIYDTDLYVDKKE